MGKKILLFSPLEDFLINPKEFLPLGILYISTYLKNKGHQVTVIHGEPEEIKEKYDFYGISASTPQYTKAERTLRYIKESFPNANVVLGGPHTIAPKCAQEALAVGFDYVVVGQGEHAMLDIILGRNSKGIITGTPLSQQELDELLPDRDALDHTQYGYPLEGGKAATIITARGCPYRCAFCSISCEKLMFRNPSKVLDEIDMLIRHYGFDRMLFLDDSFTVHKKRLMIILEKLRTHDIKYRCYARCDNSFDSELLSIMRESGCVELGVGIESGSQKILDLIDKRLTVAMNLAFIKKAQAAGIMVNAFVMIGLPGESLETVEETRNFMAQAKPKKFGYNIFTPMPDCPIVVHYDRPFITGPYKGKSFKDFINLHPLPYDKAVTKARKIETAYVSTPDLTRDDIVRIFHEEFERFVDITGFDPRTRGGRNILNNHGK
jgi:anaerobic magnesium-protoporphyrin IX monomethyl ester cyclase